ncbi:MAG: Tad domain-containing protein [Archangium sp.]|nr:Tad domain-containing protein [Archangium sp.]
MIARLRAAPRGQNMVLLSLTMLFLALMVTMTIGLGLRIRQKHELQNLADAAAYSNAVLTARTFNNMAAINRLEVSYWVAQSADQSLISWTGYARGLANAPSKAANSLRGTACVTRLPLATRSQVRTQLGQLSTDIRDYVRDELITPGWRDMDRAAGIESWGIQQRIVALRSELQDQRGEFYRQVRTQQLTQQIIAESQQDDVSVVLPPGPVNQPTGAAAVSMREVDCDFSTGVDESITGFDTPAGSGLCLRSTWSRNMYMAAMGSRGHPFLVSRPDQPTKIVGDVSRIVARGSRLSLQIGGKGGSAYWATSENHGVSSSAARAWGDDHGSITLTAAGCTWTEQVGAHVMSTDYTDTSDEHVWYPLLGATETKEEKYHTMGKCEPFCPSVWVRTVGFQPDESAANVWGQPKAVVAIQRDLTMKKFPWELHFSFPFSATGPASEWDGRGQKLHTRAGNGTSIARQAAVATGIAYYHRREHWDEFPNLLNPFWRATLVPIDIDDAPTDMGRALPGNEYRWQRDAYQALRQAGFEGLH